MIDNDLKQELEAMKELKTGDSFTADHVHTLVDGILEADEGGGFKYIAYDSTAFPYPQTLGDTTNSISGLGQANDTMLETIYLMPNNTTPTKTLMIIVEEITPSTNPKTYHYVYAGDLDSLPSDILTESDIVNDLSTGGVDKVLSAEMGQTIVERLSIISPEEQTINLKADVVWLDGNNKLGSDGSVYAYESSTIFKTSEFIDLPQGAKKIIYKGGTATSINNNAYQVAIYNDSDVCLNSYFQHPLPSDGLEIELSAYPTAVKMRISEWDFLISNGTWDISVVTLISQTNKEVFDNFAQSVDDRFDEVDEQLENQGDNYYLDDPTDVETSLKNSVVWLEGFNSINANGDVVTRESTYKTSDYINLPSNTKTINYKGGTATSINNNAYQVAIYNDSECLGTFFQYPTQEGGNVFDISNLVGATKMRISEWNNYVSNGSWDISVVVNTQKTNKETYNELLDWIDSLNQWKGKKFIAFGASNTSGGFSDGTSWIQIAAERLKMQSPISGMASRRISLKYVDSSLNLVGLAATIAECQSISASTTISYETQFANDFDCVLFGGFAGESYNESQVVIDGTTYYGGEELIDLVQLPTTRYNNNPQFTYSNGDTLAQHRDSYIGAVIYVLNELWKIKPTCRVVFTRAYLNWENYDSFSRNFNGIKKLCDKLHLPFIDLVEGIYFNGFTTGTGAEEDKTNPNIFLYDGQHASLAGRQRLANIFTHKLLLLS